MAKHSLAYPAVPASAPTSPAVTRKDRNAPATPQRSLQRASLRQLHSPYTPLTSYSTPYTPMSLRSISSSNASSLATPASVTSNRRLSLSLSPEVSFQGKNNKKSLADIADNWRTRANENGIKVSSEESQFADDEGEYMRPNFEVDTCNSWISSQTPGSSLTTKVITSLLLSQRMLRSRSPSPCSIPFNPASRSCTLSSSTSSAISSTHPDT